MLMFIKETQMADTNANDSDAMSLSQDGRDQIEVITVATSSTLMQAQQCCSPVSQSSLRTFENESICRICLDRGTEPLVSPCKCSGSAKYAHESCLLQWFFKTRRRRCELCLSEVNVKSVGFKPLQKWRLPTDSCDFVFYLFTLYCVIMFVFTGMIIWIATQGCLSPVCITLYVICSMSLVYFIYCCGCVEYSKTYWKACVTTNKNWRIYNREESARSKIKVSKVISAGSDSSNSNKNDHVIINQQISSSNNLSQADIAPHTLEATTSEQRTVSRLSDRQSLSGSATIIPSALLLDDPHRIEVLSPQSGCSPCGSPVCMSPALTSKDLAHTGSISLLMGLNYSPQQSPCTSPREKESGLCIETLTTKAISPVQCSTEYIVTIVPSQEHKVGNAKLEGDGVTNEAFDDTKL